MVRLSFPRPARGEDGALLHVDDSDLLGPVLFAAAMILFNLREAADADRVRRELADQDIKAINAGPPGRK